MREWTRPEDQHDIAEFLKFISRRCPSLETRLGVTLASKLEERGVFSGAMMEAARLLCISSLRRGSFALRRGV